MTVLPVRVVPIQTHLAKGVRAIPKCDFQRYSSQPLRATTRTISEQLSLLSAYLPLMAVLTAGYRTSVLSGAALSSQTAHYDEWVARPPSPTATT